MPLHSMEDTNAAAAWQSMTAGWLFNSEIQAAFQHSRSKLSYVVWQRSPYMQSTSMLSLGIFFCGAQGHQLSEGLSV